MMPLMNALRRVNGVNEASGRTLLVPSNLLLNDLKAIFDLSFALDTAQHISKSLKDAHEV